MAYEYVVRYSVVIAASARGKRVASSVNGVVSVKKKQVFI